MFTCEKCGKEAASKAGLAAHQRKCNGKEPEVAVESAAAPSKHPNVLKSVKGFTAYELDGFHVKDKEGRVIGHFGSADEAIKFVDNTARLVR